MSKPKKRLCSICGDELPRGELGFNPEPYKPYTSGTCCIKCYRDKVLPLRSSRGEIGIIATKHVAQIQGDWVVRNKEPL
jgi:hypothetical protein